MQAVSIRVVIACNLAAERLLKAPSVDFAPDFHTV